MSARAPMILVPGRSREAGFTMVELIMVMVIIGIVSATVVARWPAGLDLYPAADNLAQDIRFAQSLAMSRPGSFTIAYTANPASYEIRDSGGAVVHVGQLDKVTIDTAFSITFDDLGRPSAATTIILSGGGNQVQVAVIALTGAVTIT